jgi:uncharacterized membrane protein
VADSIERSIDVHAPIDTVYEEWLDLEAFPRFMERVKEVRRQPDGTYLWRADVGGREASWLAEVVDAVPNERIAWRSVDGRGGAGEVTFLRMQDTTTTVTLHLRSEPESATDLDAGRVEDDLEAFKRYVEGKYDKSGWHDPKGR